MSNTAVEKNPAPNSSECFGHILNALKRQQKQCVHVKKIEIFQILHGLCKADSVE